MTSIEWRLAACLGDRDFDLLEERLGPRIDPHSAAAGPTRPNPKIVALFPCHCETIGIAMNPYKSCRASIASNRVRRMMANKQRRLPSTHIASAIAWKIEIKQKKFCTPACHPAQRQSDTIARCKNQCADKPDRQPERFSTHLGRNLQ